MRLLLGRVMFSHAFSTKGKNVLSCLKIGYNIPRFFKYVITLCLRNCSLLTQLKVVGSTEKWEKPQADRTSILDGFSTRDEHCLCNFITLRTAETRESTPNVSVTRDVPLLTSLCCSVFYCRCRCSLLLLTQPVLVVVGAVKVTGLKDPLNNLLQGFIWENGTEEHQHHLSPHHLLLLLSFLKITCTFYDPFAAPSQSMNTAGPGFLLLLSHIE